MATRFQDLKADHFLDFTGQDCPVPVLRTKLALREMACGKVVHVRATDPHAKVDFEAFCARTGHELVHQETRSGVLHFFIRKKPGARA